MSIGAAACFATATMRPRDIVLSRMGPIGATQRSKARKMARRVPAETTNWRNVLLGTRAPGSSILVRLLVGLVVFLRERPQHRDRRRAILLRGRK